MGPMRSQRNRWNHPSHSAVPNLRVAKPLEQDFSELRNRLRLMDRKDAEALILHYQTEALETSEQIGDYLVGLAGVLEQLEFGPSAPRVGDEDCSAFWEKVVEAKKSLDKRGADAKIVKENFGDEVFAHFGWERLAQSPLKTVRRFAVRCAKWAPKDPWSVAVVGFNRTMLVRDKRVRDNRIKLKKPNDGLLIGQHWGMTKVQDECCPLGTCDFQDALDLVPDYNSSQPLFRKWEWSLEETMKYLSDNGLGFGKHGIIVPRGEQTSRQLVRRYLGEVLDDTAILRARVIPSPNASAGFRPSAPNPACFPRSNVVSNPWEGGTAACHTLVGNPEDSGTTQDELDSSGLPQDCYTDQSDNESHQSSPGLPESAFVNSDLSFSGDQAVRDPETPMTPHSLFDDDTEEDLWSVEAKMTEVLKWSRGTSGKINRVQRQEISSLIQSALVIFRLGRSTEEPRMGSNFEI